MHTRPASDDGTLSDRSRMRRVCCTPPGQPASGHIDRGVAAVAVATVAVAALAAATYHPARAERENHKLVAKSFISFPFLFGELHNAAYT